MWPRLITLDTSDPLHMIIHQYLHLVRLILGLAIKTYLHVMHPPLDFGAPFLGTNERVIMLMGVFYGCIVFRLCPIVMPPAVTLEYRVSRAVNWNSFLEYRIRIRIRWT